MVERHLPLAESLASFRDRGWTIRRHRSTEDVVEAMHLGGAYAPQSLDAPVSGEEPDGLTLLDHVVDTRREIANRVGCSQMHVSRILTEALARLRDAATSYD
jgi:hypothetical protein